MAGPHWYTFVSRTKIEKPRGNNDAYWVTHLSYAKPGEYSEESPSPYLIPNEWIAGNLANFLRLRIPPFALMQENRLADRMFASLQFTNNQTPPPDTRPLQCWKADPLLCSGVLLFDVLIANDDRREDNLGVDDAAAPKEITPFDCDSSLFGRMLHDGAKRLAKLRDHFGMEHHCLLDVIDSDEHFQEWFKRIRSIPQWFLKEICYEVVGREIKKTDAKAAADFLDYRCQNLSSIIRANKRRFPKIRRWKWIV